MLHYYLTKFDLCVLQVKVMLKICPSQHYGEQGTTFLAIDPRKKQVTVFDPTPGSGFSTAAHRRASAAAPKMFAFDAVFSPDDSQVYHINFVCYLHRR